MSVDVYPCTYDCPVDEGGDPLLDCLLVARERIFSTKSTMDMNQYIDICGDTCAVGAVLAADGILWEDVHNKGLGQRLLGVIDHKLSDTAKEALRRLDEVAVERRPKSAEYGSWCGPLEWINESWKPNLRENNRSKAQKKIRREILAIYDETIARRQKEIPAPPETWPIIEHEEERIPVVPPELLGVS